ncbi:histidinol-phosphatase HisJ [Romboutsia sp. 13368]|uniref:histidinol-phosphatase HisJ n=1 Tax=Romboutsia sp. 13368 TaxID=2708053 RepID=UPI0025E16247|nr:histidinol-phosphatase HisJ [Romboutsia sp. 13368]
MKDGHIHSPYCPHGSSDQFEKYIKKALEVGVMEMTFTEHLPLPKNFKDPSPENNSAMTEDDLLNYFNELKKLKEKYKHSVKINIGVEVDYIEGYEEEIKEMLDKYGEYIDDSILSVHMIKLDGKYHLIDYSAEEFCKLIELIGSIEKVYYKYYQTLKLAINSDLGIYKPRRIGHLNLVRKFNKIYPYDYSNMDILEELVRLIKSKNYELDFNVSGYRQQYCNEAYIDGHLLELVRKYDVKTVLGSDSHSHDTVGYKMKEYDRLMNELQIQL